MLRWFLSILAASVTLAACGRQLTGLDAPGNGSIQPGQMLIRYRVAGQLDFTNVEYLIVFNTSGNGQEPYPALNLSGYKNYSYAFVIGGNAATSLPLFDQFYLAPGGGIGFAPVVLPVQDYVYIPNSGGNPLGGGEFTLTFDRRLMNQPSPLQPQAAPTATPAAQSLWAINFITASPNGNSIGTPIDSMGLGGAQDTTFTQGVVDTTKPVDLAYPKNILSTSVNNPAAQLQSFEIINAP